MSSLELLQKRFTDLQEKLNVLQDATNQLQELITRLATLDFQPGSVPLDAADGDDVNAELSTEIIQILREQEEELELLQEEIIDLPMPAKSDDAIRHNKDRLKDGADRLGRELQLCRTSFRKAQIMAKNNLESARLQEQKLLIASFTAAHSGASSPAPDGSAPTATGPLFSLRKQQTKELSKEDQMINASHDVTESMRRTHDMMAAELAKSDFAHNALKESTEALSQLSENYSSLDTMLSSSRALLGTLLKSQKTDTWYLQSAFYLLVVTVAWLFFRRLLWGPLWWLVWLPIKLMFRTTVGVSKVVAPRGAEVSAESEVPLMSSSVAHMNNEGAPTILVDAQAVESQVAQPDDPVLEHINEIINESHIESTDPEAEIKEETVLRDREEGEEPNPKKRMMEEEVEVVAESAEPDDQRLKDEL